MAFGYSILGQWVTGSDVPQNAGTLVPITLTAAEIASPTAAQIANVFATFQLDVAPFTRYRSNGTTLVDISV